MMASSWVVRVVSGLRLCTNYLVLIMACQAAGARVRTMAQKTDADWKETLTPEQFHVLRQNGTERAGTSPLNLEKRSGTFTCAGCGQPLFTSDTKFESGTGWPGVYKAS